MSADPLVSVCVTTYNASTSILETLESIRLQTYTNIELIISDDCSNDDTVAICKEWIKENQTRFINSDIITSNINTGISANANRACEKAHGEWIKLIGDDILCKTAIATYITYIKENTSCHIVFAKAKLYTPLKQYNKKVLPSKLSLYDLEPHEQFIKLLENNPVVAPTSFISKTILRKYKFDERFKNIEDYPMWLRLTHDGIKLYFIDKITVHYRVTNNSLSNNRTTFLSPLLLDSLVKFFYLVKKQYLVEFAPHLYKKEWRKIIIFEIAVVKFNNKKNIFTRIYLRVIRTFLYLFT